MVVFPTVPTSFNSLKEYVNYWLSLIQYEIYSKLLARGSNEQKNIKVDEDIEKLELLPAAEKQTGIWVSWVSYIGEKVEGKRKSSYNKRQFELPSFILKMYSTLPMGNIESDYSSDDSVIMEADSKFNINFKLGDVRQYDLLLLSFVELDIGEAKNFKEKVKTIDELLDFVYEDDCSLALVVESLFQTAFDKDDKEQDHILVQVNEYNRSFTRKLKQSSLSRLYVYHISDVSQDLKQYKAVMGCSKLHILPKLLKPPQNLVTPVRNPSFKLPGEMQKYSSNFNESQMVVFQQVAAARTGDVVLV